MYALSVPAGAINYDVMVIGTEIRVEQIITCKFSNFKSECDHRQREHEEIKSGS